MDDMGERVPGARAGRAWLAAGLLAAGTGLLYAVTLCREPAPGSSAHLLAGATGLAPRFSPLFPWWTLLVRLTAGAAPAAHLAAASAALSAAFAAATLAGLFLLLRTAVRAAAATAVQGGAGRANAAAAFGGFVAAAALALSAPFWTAATRAHPASLHALLLVAAAGLLLDYLRTGSVSRLAAAAFVGGASLPEAPALFAVLPFFLAAALWRLAGDQRFTPRQLLPPVLAGLTGLALYVAAAALFRLEPAAAWRGCDSLPAALWTLLRDQARVVRFSVPRVGWIPLLALTVVPAATAAALGSGTIRDLLRARVSAAPPPAWTLLALHVVLAAAALFVLGPEAWKPWSAGAEPAVIPALAASAVLGYVAACVLLLPAAFRPRRTAPAWAAAGAGALVAALAAVTGLQFRDADFQSPRIAGWVARRIVGTLGPQVEWLVSDGPWGDCLRLEAAARGRRMSVLENLRDPLLRPYFASLAADDRLRNLAGLGGDVLLRERLRAEPSAAARIALAAHPLLWREVGLAARPRGLFFEGAERLETNEVARIAEENIAFARELGAALEGMPSSHPAAARLAAAARAHAARAVNHCGLLCEVAGRDEAARAAYSAARALFPESLSATLNLWSLALRAGRSDEADELAERARALVDVRAGPDAVQAALRRDGGLAQSDLLASLLRPAGRPAETPSSPNVGRIADVGILSPEAEATGTGPGPAPRLIAQAGAAAQAGRHEEAARLLDEAEKAGGADPGQLALARAVLDAAAGRWPAARERLETALRAHPSLIPGWSMLADLQLRAGDEAAARETLLKLRALPGADEPAARLEARLAFAARDWARAAAALEKALGRIPNRPALMRTLVLTLMEAGQREQAEGWAVRLLRLDPGDATANHVRGRGQAERGENALADDSFRRSLERERQPQALNDYAWFLLGLDRAAEAEPLAREAAAAAPLNANIRDTLGGVLLRRGALEEARAAFAACVELDPAHLGGRLGLAETALRSGRRQEAAQLLEQARSAAGGAPPPDALQRLEALEREARLSPGEP